MNNKTESMTSFSATPVNQVGTELYTNLGGALIKLCMQDGEEASRMLSVKLSNVNSQLNNLKIKLAENMEPETMAGNVDIALSELIGAFMQLQFFDRVAQRLDHATQSLDFALDPAQMGQSMDKRFTMEDERVLYNALLDGEDVDGAVSKATTRLDVTLDKTNGDDIELF